jgi:hypothetical protein
MIKIANYKIELKGKKIYIHEPSGWFTNNGIFYYTREETKKLHSKNLKNKPFNVYKHNQLVGMQTDIVNKRVYTRLINAYIRGGL